MMAEEEHTSEGKAALICGILSIIIVWIPFINFVSFIRAIVAIVLGYLARKKGDGYGLVGIILGVVVLVLAIITIIVAAAVYTYVTNMIPPGL